MINYMSEIPPYCFTTTTTNKRTFASEASQQRKVERALHLLSIHFISLVLKKDLFFISLSWSPSTPLSPSTQIKPHPHTRLCMTEKKLCVCVAQLVAWEWQQETIFGTYIFHLLSVIAASACVDCCETSYVMRLWRTLSLSFNSKRHSLHVMENALKHKLSVPINQDDYFNWKIIFEILSKY